MFVKEPGIPGGGQSGGERVRKQYQEGDKSKCRLGLVKKMQPINV